MSIDTTTYSTIGLDDVFCPSDKGLRIYDDDDDTCYTYERWQVAFESHWECQEVWCEETEGNQFNSIYIILPLPLQLRNNVSGAQYRIQKSMYLIWHEHYSNSGLLSTCLKFKNGMLRHRRGSAMRVEGCTVIHV